MGIYREGDDVGRAFVYGAEYQTHDSPGYLHALYQHDVPCAVCLRRNRSISKCFQVSKYFKIYRFKIYHLNVHFI